MRFGNAQDAARKTEAFEEEFSDSDRMTDLRPSYQRRRLWSVSLFGSEALTRRLLQEQDTDFSNPDRPTVV
jgi:hypothetical protein